MKMLNALAAFVLGLSISAPAFANEYTGQVKAQLAAVQLLLQQNGWRETHNTIYDKLKHGGTDTYVFTLKKGITYKIISVCDEDCADLDLVLYDENGNEISRDTSNDSAPIVDANPAWTGQFRLKVKMYSCRKDPCYYGITVLGQ